MPSVVPKCLALVLCRGLDRDKSTAEPSIARAFDVIEVPSLPASAPPFVVWMQVTDGNGLTAMELVIEYVPTGVLEPKLVLPVRFNLHFQSPNAVLEHVIRFTRGVELEQMGRYRLRLAADGITIAQRYFLAVQAP